MNAWIRKIHMYAGLLNFSILAVFGIAGLVVTFEAPDIFRQKNGPTVTMFNFDAPPSAADKQVSQAIADTLHIRVGELPNPRRNAAHQLVTDFYSPNGLVRATLMESEHRLQVQTYRNSIWRFMDNMHATTLGSGAPGSALRAWSWYVEFATWSLIGMSLTGLWLALATRWNYRWTRASVALGGVLFGVLYYLEK